MSKKYKGTYLRYVITYLCKLLEGQKAKEHDIDGNIFMLPTSYHGCQNVKKFGEDLFVGYYVPPLLGIRLTKMVGTSMSPHVPKLSSSPAYHSPTEMEDRMDYV